MTTVYVSIGNSDDKLPQARWAEFWALTNELLVDVGVTSAVHGVWQSAPTAAFQNACWCVEVKPEHAEVLRFALGRLAAKFDQDSIAWAEVPQGTHFIGQMP